MTQNHCIALVGMPGSGKSTIAGLLKKHGYATLRFGDITEKSLIAQGKQVNEQNERAFRENIRKEHGMAAYAIRNLPEIQALLSKGNVVADGLYSWEEYMHLREKLGSRLIVVHVYSSPSLRYHRLGSRAHRPLTAEEARSRDHAEIEQLNKGGPIAMADFVVPECDLDTLPREVDKLVATCQQQQAGKE
ncbi:hypothetical protein AUJ68_00625 [Candidatus Woesearchaeota archaeon CG1_02_57_44]|nr:MAG: hypothetical protein AUJ68_00625 [Candidatus Woesearchaeota archaeon CG1_02_57_44]